MKRWCVVLVSPQEGGNVGAAARVMKNFGVRELRVVAPRCEANGDAARKMCAGSGEILRAARPFAALPEALADIELSIGLTGVSGKHHRLDCIELVPHALLEGRDALAKCALVFGREDRGMEGEELHACDFLWSLPTQAAFPSLNLAQAIGIALAGVAEAERTLGLARLGRGIAQSTKALNPLAGSPDPADRPALGEEKELLVAHFAQLMRRLNWQEGKRLEGSLSRLRNLLVRANATRRDVDMLHGLCRESLRRLGGTVEPELPPGEPAD